MEGPELDPTIRRALDALVVVAAVVFTLLMLQPRLLVADTTPAGGDMGAHVWGPAYLRDHLLPNLRLTGWTPDWYDGFPAFHFYMVVPALLIVAVNSGWQGWAALVPAVVAAGVALAGLLTWSRWRRRALYAVAIAVAVLGVGVPYGVAFKWVTVLGVLGLPVAAYVFGRLADLSFPSPALLSAASVAFLFNREPLLNNTGNIIGGNIASTLAGEYSFSLSLTFALLYLGVLLRGLRTGRHRGLAAVLAALTVLCHLIPALFAGVATVAAVLVHQPYRQRIRWLLPTVPVAGLLASFWVLPFLLRRDYLNDMGWQKLPGENSAQTIWSYLLPRPLWIVAALAMMGIGLSIVLVIRAGLVLTITMAAFGVAFVVMPQARLWNARLLPFHLLCLFLLAGLAVAEIGRALAVIADRAAPMAGAAVVGALAVYVLVGLPLGVLPGETTGTDGSKHWLGLEVRSGDADNRAGYLTQANVVRDWARWNYSGYERKPAYPEYHALVQTMDRVGDERGCGRAFWEYENDRLNSYGTPMAPMLLPFWTDGCIGSQEGLYFESSATVPYHFLMQSTLSPEPSRAMRDLPYTSFDLSLGVRQLQLLGVRYYLAFSDQAVAAAAAHPALTEIATSGPWHVYEVADADVVQPLTSEPAVLTGVDAHEGWLDAAVAFFTAPERWDVLLAADGPSSWARVGPDDTPPVRRVDAVAVDDVDVGRDGISFDVSTPGTPVLVKASYFPNWKVSGAEGPYRVTPNLMVVVPTDTHVELRYGWTGVDVGAYALTALGLVALFVLARRPPVEMPEPPSRDGVVDEEPPPDDDWVGHELVSVP
jgi:hypothetical protein